MGRRTKDDIPRPFLDPRAGRERIRVCGKAIWLGAPGSTQARERYAAILAAWMASGGRNIDAALDAPAFQPPPGAAKPKPSAIELPHEDDLSVGGLCLRYMAHARGSKSAAELRKVSRWWRAREISNALYSRRTMPVAKFGPRTLREIRDELASKPRQAKLGGKRVTRCRNHINRLVREITAMFGWGVSEELVPVTVWQALKSTPPLRRGESAAREAVPREPVADGVLKATLAHMPAVLADLVRLMRVTACRPDEVCRLRMADVRPEGGVLRWTLARHKTAHHGVERAIPLGKRAAAIISRWAAGKPPEAPVFSRHDRKRARTAATIRIRRWRLDRDAFTPDDIRKAVAAACKQAGVPAWTPYQLRHAALTEVRLKFGVEAETALAGWTSPRLANHYAKVTFAEGARLAKRIG